MKIDRVTYKKKFPTGAFLNEDIGLEMILENGDSVEDALKYAKEKAEEFHRGNNPQLYKDGVLSTIYQFMPEVEVSPKLPKEQRAAALISDINSCTELKVLESYRFIAKQDPKVQAAYNLRIKALSNG